MQKSLSQWRMMKSPACLMPGRTAPGEDGGAGAAGEAVTLSYFITQP